MTRYYPSSQDKQKCAVPIHTAFQLLRAVDNPLTGRTANVYPSASPSGISAIHAVAPFRTAHFRTADTQNRELYSFVPLPTSKKTCEGALPTG